MNRVQQRILESDEYELARHYARTNYGVELELSVNAPCGLFGQQSFTDFYDPAQPGPKMSPGETELNRMIATFDVVAGEVLFGTVVLDTDALDGFEQQLSDLMSSFLAEEAGTLDVAAHGQAKVVKVSIDGQDSYYVVRPGERFGFGSLNKVAAPAPPPTPETSPAFDEPAPDPPPRRTIATPPPGPQAEVEEVRVDALETAPPLSVETDEEPGPMLEAALQQPPQPDTELDESGRFPKGSALDQHTSGLSEEAAAAFPSVAAQERALKGSSGPRGILHHIQSTKGETP